MNFALFRNRNFSLFVLGNGTALFGTLFLQMALSLYILDLTGSAAKFASTLFFGLLPNLLFGLFAGAVVDRLDRKKLLVRLDLIRAVFLAGLFVYALFQPVGEAIIYILVAFLGACDIFFVPAYVTVLPSIVKKEELVETNNVYNGIMDTLRLVAPVLAAALYSQMGLPVMLLLNALTFAVSTWATYRLTMPPHQKPQAKKSLLSDIAGGFQLFRHDIRITSLVVNGMLTHLFLTSLVLVGFPYMIKEVFHGSDVQVGIVESMATVGSLSAFFIVEWLRRKQVSISQGIFLGILGMNAAVLPMLLLGSGAFLVLLGKNTLFMVAFFSLITLLMYWMFRSYGVFFVSFYQTNVPNHMMGRYFSIMSLCFALGRSGGFAMYGYLLDRHVLLISILVLAVGMVLKIVTHVPFMREEKRLKTLEVGSGGQAEAPQLNT